MSDKSDKELADNLDAQDRLRSRGYKWKTCVDCMGLGFHIVKGERSGEEFAACRKCMTCKGRGGLWEPPII